jgi:microcystin-dependent protein
MRLIKSTVKATFPNFTSTALQSTQAQIDLATQQAQGLAAEVLPKGTAALPGIAFLADLGTGVFSPAAGQIGLSLAGVQALLMGSSALVTSLGIGAPAITITGAYSGGTGQLVPIGHTGIWWDDVLPVEGGYVWCNGVPISRTAYPILFARWGTRFGAGDGSTTFGIPNLCDTVPVGKSTMGGIAARGLQTLANTTLNSVIGAANYVLSVLNLPPINSSAVNTFTVSAVSGGINIPVNNSTLQAGFVSAFGGSGPQFSFSGGNWGSVTSLQGSPNIVVNSNSTANNPMSLVQPSTTCNYILRAA